MKKTLTLSLALLLCICAMSQTNKQIADSIPAPVDGNIELNRAIVPGEVEGLFEGTMEDDEVAPLEEKAEKEAVASPEVRQAAALDRYRNAPYPSAAGPDLIEAYELSERKVELLDEMMAYYEIVGDEASIQVTADKIRTTAKYHPSIMRYQDHLLQAIPDGSILITNGEWDSYPLICRMMDKEKNVLMVNLQLLADPMYRESRLPEKGLSVPSGLNGAIPKDILRELQPSLYLNGLSFRYGQVTSLQDLSEQWTNSLSSELSGETALPVTVARLRLNYLPMLATILRQYEAEGLKDEEKKVKAVIHKICVQAGRPELKKRFK